MKYCRGLVLLVLASGCQGNARPPAEPTGQVEGELQEPPERFSLESDGKRVAIELDSPVDTAAFRGAKTVTLRAEPHRVFRYAGLQFHYPREYTFEANRTPEVTTWVVSGTDCKILVSKFPTCSDTQGVLRVFKRNLLERYRDGQAKESAVKLDVAGGELSGERIEFTVAGTLMRQDIYPFKSGRDAVLFVVQDTLRGGKASQDRERAEEMLNETFRGPAN